MYGRIGVSTKATYMRIPTLTSHCPRSQHRHAPLNPATRSVDILPRTPTILPRTKFAFQLSCVVVSYWTVWPGWQRVSSVTPAALHDELNPEQVPIGLKSLIMLG